MVRNDSVRMASSFFLGGRDDARNVRTERDIRRELQSRFDEIRRLNDELRRVSRPGNETSMGMDEFARRLDDACPFLDISARASNSGVAQDFIQFKVTNSPFYIFNGSGTPLYVTAPMYELNMSMTQSNIIGFQVSAAPWRTVRNMLPPTLSAADIERTYGPNSLDMDFGHPHDSHVSPGRTHTDSLCLGDNRFSTMLGTLTDRATMLIFIKRVYAWLTEVNKDSMYHREITPIRYGSGTLAEINGACNAKRAEIATLLHGNTCRQYVHALNTDGLNHSTEVATEIISFVESNFSNVKTIGQMFPLLKNEYEARMHTSRATPHYVLMALFRYLCAMYVLSRSTLHDTDVVVRSALSDLMAIPAAYQNIMREDSLGLRGTTTLKRNEIKKFVADYETL